MGKISIVTLGQSGVIIDPQTLDPSVPEDALVLAQNATHDPRAGHGGALRKRPGLARFNYLYAGGSILGGIPMAVAEDGGAPYVPPDPGAGDGDGGPGGGGPIYTPEGAPIWNGGNQLFGGARLVIIGRADNLGSGANFGGAGWYVSSKGLADSANSLTTPGPPAQCYSYPETALFQGAAGKPAVFHEETGYLFYTVGYNQPTGTTGTDVPTIRKVNGAEDVAVTAIPYLSSGAHNGAGTATRQFVTGMHLGVDGVIYVTVKGKAGGQTTAGSYGAVYRLDPASNTLSLITQNTYLPYCVAYHNGAIYWGTFDITASSEVTVDQNSTVYASRADDWTNVVTEHGFSGNAQVDTCMLAFPKARSGSSVAQTDVDRCLFMGTGARMTVSDHAPLYVRNREALQSSTAWTAATPSTLAADALGAFPGCHWSSMVEFDGKLYAAYYSTRNYVTPRALIYELVPNYSNVESDGGWDGTGTWTLRVTDTTAGILPFSLFVDDGVIYALSAWRNSGAIRALSSTDGITWTNRSANLPIGANNAGPIPVLFGVDQ